MNANTGDLTGDTSNESERRWRMGRIAYWSAAALVILMPLVAMQVTDDVNWTAFDFAFAAAALLGVGALFEIAVRKSGDTVYRAAVGVALATALVLVWVNGAVGILGSEDNDANLLYVGVLVIGVIGALVARFRPWGMARAMAATAAAQAAVAVGALIAGWGGAATGPFEVVALNGFFVALWACTAVLFAKAARRPSERRGASL